MHLFLSPHSDDVVLSCGGQIATLTRSGERVTIFTVMAGDPPVGFQPTEFTRELHERWNLADDEVIEARRAEDKDAGKILGAEVKFGPYADAVYRINPNDGTPLYPDKNAVFGEVHPDDPVREAKRAAVIQVIMKLFDLGNDDVVHAPLGVGHHVDHQLVRDMGKAIAIWRPNIQVYFYDDYPYSLQGQNIIKRAANALEVDVVRTLRPVDSAATDAKITAAGCYQSQISTFWDTPNKMSREIRAFTNQVGGEGEWHLLNN